jgi:hypothetical protein
MARAIARLRATVWGELLAEFLGTFVLIAFGDGVVAIVADRAVTGGHRRAHPRPASPPASTTVTALTP